MERKGQWKLGESGNPSGKPRGTLSASTKLRKLIDVQAIIRQLQQDALKGDVQAARTLHVSTLTDSANLAAALRQEVARLSRIVSDGRAAVTGTHSAAWRDITGTAPWSSTRRSAPRKPTPSAPNWPSGR